MNKFAILALGALFLGLAACSPKTDEGGTTGDEPTTTSSTEGGTSTEGENQVATLSYASDIEPIIKANCMQCHVGDGAKEGFDVSSFESFAKGTSHGAVYTAGDTSGSLLVKVINGDGAKQMPPGKKMSDEDIAKITSWVEQGANP
ncbi:MAG: c-type cytochrome [Armatimonadetes bacterium]|nr:c-type cytochrome [Armatimonadota bacterium]